MTELGSIYQCAVHVPRLRLPRSVIAAAMSWTDPPDRAGPDGERAIGNWDEDALTMGVEAARACLADVPPDLQPPTVEALLLCSTTLPFADRDDAVLAAAALDLPEGLDSLNLCASNRAGTGGLIHALGRNARGQALVVASELRPARPGSPEEMRYGDAAVALLVGPAGAPALATALAVQRVGSDFVDHYRMSGSEFSYSLEERWVRDESMLKLIPPVVAALLTTAGVQAAQVTHLAIPTSSATAKRVAQACGLAAARHAERIPAGCGDAGSASPLLLLAESLESAVPGDHIVLLGLGQGVDAVLLRVDSGVRGYGRPVSRALDCGREEPHYVRYLSHRGLVDVDFGMRAERDQRTAHSVAYRKRFSLSAFRGGRCTECGTVQFPQSRVCVNPACRMTDSQAPYRLAESQGRVKSFTEDWQAYAARPPYVYGNVEFNEGGNLFMEFTDVEPGELKVGSAVRFVFRIKDEDRQRGFRRYFWKATPAMNPRQG